MGKALICVATGCFLAACQTTGGSFCDLAKPIRLTPEQIEQLTEAQVNRFLGHNKRGERECSWRP